MTGLQIAPDLALPVDAATETFGILAKKGAGKSNAAVVMAEEMYDAGVPWVAVDPKGDWWGIRSSADGRGPSSSRSPNGSTAREPLPTGPALLDEWLREGGMLGKGERDVLRELVERWPDRITGPALAESLGKEWSGGFRNILSRLRTLELIVGTNTGGVAAHDDFIEAIR